MTDAGPSPLAPNPMIAHVLRGAPEAEEIVQLRGYVGASSPDTLTLYEDLALTRYFAIPHDAVVGSSYGGDPDTDPVTVYVRGSAKIVWARSLTASTASRTRRLKGFMPKLRGDWVTGHLECEVGSDGEVRCNYVTELPE